MDASEPPLETQNPIIDSKCFVTIVTTPAYCIGVIILAKSLQLHDSYPLLCYYTKPSLLSDLTSLSKEHNVSSCNLIFRPLPSADDHFDPNLPETQFVDCPRRALFLLKQGFVYLDCDMIVVKPINDLVDMLESRRSESVQCFAVPNFRNKKRKYADHPSGNFNAGVMICPHAPAGAFLDVYNRCADILSSGYDDTEEKLLNDVFRDRWDALPVSYNTQKRCFRLSPGLWNASEIKVLHYVGAKPWQTREYISDNDWESKHIDVGEVYRDLFVIWRNLAAGLYKTSKDLQNAVRSVSPSVT